MRYLNRLFLFGFVTLFLCGCSIASKEPLSKTGFYFDTVITITLYDSKNEEILNTCFDYCKEFENLVSRTIQTSEISQINHANGQPVEVSDTTIQLLKKGLEFGGLTDGAFDITIAPLMEVWDVKNNPGNVPSESDIAEALSHVNYKNIVIEGNAVTLTDPEAAIDLGGIAKGYMADQLKEYLLSEGVTSAIINLGGNVLTIGEKPDGTSFNIGIQKPFDKQNATITSVQVKDSSVVTSGSYERYFKVDDVIYHHILNTETGYPCDNELLSVTILSEESIDGDALSTACFTLGLEEGRKLIESLEDIDAIFVTENYEIIDTRNHSSLLGMNKNF